MLAQLGALQFAVAPFNTNTNDHEAGATFAAHDVIGRMPALEFMGEAAETWNVRGTLFPHKLGGLDHLEVLHGMRRSGQAQFFMRGDGVPLGWVVVETVREKSSYLDRSGVGRVIEFEIGLKRSDPPNAAGIFAALTSLFL